MPQVAHTPASAHSHVVSRSVLARMLCAMTQHVPRPPLTFLRKLCPDCTIDELDKAEINIFRYLETVHAIFERLERERPVVEPGDIPSSDSTKQTTHPTIPSL